MGPITDAHKLEYNRNVQLVVQQRRSRLEPAFTFEPSLKGRLAQILELIGSTTAVIDLPRKADTPDIDNTIEPIWVVPHQIAWGKLIEREDQIKAFTDYQSPFVQAGAASVVRAVDVILAASIFGNRKIGQDGSGTSSWNGQTVGVGVGAGPTDDTTPTGMNVRKLIRGVRYMQAAQVEIDYEQLFAEVNAQGMEELYRDITFVNTDYRSKSVLEGKQVREIMGITIIPADGAAAQPDYDGTTYTAALWAKSGVHYGDFDPLRTDVPLRPDKMNRPHPQMERWMGASRSEDAKVVKILNKK